MALNAMVRAVVTALTTGDSRPPFGPSPAHFARPESVNPRSCSRDPSRHRIVGAGSARGFTLIEVMITVAIVAILAMVAYPSYRDYIVRGQLVDATNGLATFRANMERHFQDNRTYQTVGTFTSPCLVPEAQRRVGNFVISCNPSPPAANAYVLQAVGAGPVTGFTFTINHQDIRGTTAVPAGWGAACASGWILRRGQPCT
jgi:prepilin-type N-terminal cleavage/methylation domain-containing protein